MINFNSRLHLIRYTSDGMTQLVSYDSDARSYTLVCNITKYSGSPADYGSSPVQHFAVFNNQLYMSVRVEDPFGKLFGWLLSKGSVCLCAGKFDTNQKEGEERGDQRGERVEERIEEGEERRRERERM